MITKIVVNGKDTIFYLYATLHASFFHLFFSVSSTLETLNFERSVESRTPVENFLKFTIEMSIEITHIFKIQIIKKYINNRK